MQHGFFWWRECLDRRNYPFHNVKREKHNLGFLICPRKAWRWVLSDWLRVSGNLGANCANVALCEVSFCNDWFTLPEIWGSVFVLYAPQFPFCFFNNLVKPLAGWLFYAIHANHGIFSFRFQRTSILTWTQIRWRVSCALTLPTLTPPLWPDLQFSQSPTLLQIYIWSLR